MAEQQEIIKFNKELIPKLKTLAEKNIDQLRNHLLQICLISGVISAFLIPLYTSKDFSSSQHFFVALSLICFLLSILIGMLYLSCELTKEQKNILEMIDIMEEEDAERAKEFRKKYDKPLNWWASNDIKAWLADVLFAAGIILLICVIFINETGGYYFKK